MIRRTFLTTALSAGAITCVGGVAWFSIEPNRQPLTIAHALAQLEPLVAQNAHGSGAWSLYKVLVHSAQSVEFSLTGFPEHKPDAFKSTIGRAAFRAFLAKGKMRHGLDEPIPGAPMITDSGNIQLAFARLKKALQDFQQSQGELAPHFAYGALNKAEYEAAHVMHINNHLQEFGLG